MKPSEPWRPCAQIERKRPAAEDDFGSGEETVAFLAAPRAGGARPQVAGGRIGRPGFAIFAIEPAAGLGQSNPLIDGFDLGPIRRTQALNVQDVHGLHGVLAQSRTVERPES